MIKKLQRKFILIAMGSLLLVLLVIIGGANVLSWGNVKADADNILLLLSENDGTFPDFGGKMPPPPPGMTLETPHESRFFWVAFDNVTQAVTRTETRRVARIDTAEALAYAETALKKSASQGFVEEYRYLRTVDGGQIRILFLDCTRSIDAFHSFLLASVGTALVGFFIVVALIVLLSNWIIRPVSESYEKQKRFITDAGHEIKTPLTIIGADADLLEMEFGESEWLCDIKKQARRLTGLTNDLVLLARMEEGDKTMPMIDFPVSDVVGETAASFQALAQTQDKQFSLSVQPMLSLCGNEKAIQQMVAILLDNALKYSPTGGSISLDLIKQNKSLRLSVCNTTAEPIMPSDLNRLFERFYRADPSRNSETGGYGIGLSVAKAIAEAHGGRIQASSADGQSLTMTVSFPA